MSANKERNRRHPAAKKLDAPFKELQYRIIDCLSSGKYRVEPDVGAIYLWSPIVGQWNIVPSFGKVYRKVLLHDSKGEKVSAYLMHVIWLSVYGIVPPDHFVAMRDVYRQCTISNLYLEGKGKIEPELFLPFFKNKGPEVKNKYRLTTFNRKLTKKDAARIREIYELNPKITSTELAAVMRCKQSSAANALRKVKRGLKLTVETNDTPVLKDVPWARYVNLSDYFLHDLDPF